MLCSFTIFLMDSSLYEYLDALFILGHIREWKEVYEYSVTSRNYDVPGLSDNAALWEIISLMLVNKGVMGESVRKRRSLWDTEENFSRHDLNAKNVWVGKGDYPSHDGRSYQEQGSSKTDSSSKRHSGWNHSPQNSLLQTSQKISKDVERLPETEDHKREKFYRENMSPTFDGQRQQRNSQFPEHGLSQSRRHPGRGRSRSPGRAKGRSRSRSWSRDRGWRSRSRSRSRDKGNLRGRSRSRSSPPNYKGDPYGRDDRQIGSRLSSKVCRDFASGNCRRGGECRFFHPDNFNRDGYSSEYNLAERRGSWNENGDTSRYANSEAIEVHSRGKIPDAYNLEHELPRNNRGAITCRDFVIGKCRWGASCRFSHSGTSGHNYDSGIRNASSDYDREHEPSKTSKRLCKYFVAGKCYSESCKFSHDGPTPRNVEMRPSDDIGGHRLDEKNDSWVGPKWNDAEMNSSFMRDSRRGESVAKSDNSGSLYTDRYDHIGDHSVADTNKLWNKPAWDDTTRASTLERNSGWDDTALRTNPMITIPLDQTNSRWTHSLENERAIWKNTTSSEERDDTPNFIAANTSESILESLTNNQENIISQASQSRNLNGSSVHGERQDTIKETPGIMISTEVMQPCLSSNPYVESYPFEDSGKTIISNVSSDVNNSRQSIHPVSLPEQSFNEISERASRASEYSSFLDGPAQGEARLHAIPSNGHDIRSNESTQSYQKEAATRLEVIQVSAPQNLSGAIFSVPTAQLHDSLASLTKKFEYEPSKSQLHAVVLPSVVPSEPNSELLPTYNAVYTQPNPVVNATNDGFQWGVTPGNCVMPAANASYLGKQETSVTLKQSNELSALNSENGNIEKFDDSNVEYTKDQCLKQQEAVAKSEVNGNNRVVSKECEDGKENKNSHNANDHDKDEEINGHKDDKVIRLFKNALIEFVKEILKPTWKEGRMSREVHKTVVKKVVDKVTGSIQGDHFPKTQDKIEQYLSSSKTKIKKLAQAYVERCLKANS